MRKIRVQALLGLTLLGQCQCSGQARPLVQGAARASSSDAEYSLTQQSASHPDRGACRGGRCDDTATTTNVLGRCDVESCEGELTPTAISELRATAAKTNDCYERELKDQNQLEGKMMVRLRLAAGREPCEIRVEQSSISGSETFLTCVTDRLRQTEAHPSSGCIDVALPLSFVRKEVESMPDASAGGAAVGK